MFAKITIIIPCKDNLKGENDMIQWRPVISYEDYMVNNDGEIMRVSTGHTFNSHGMTRRKVGKQYKIIHLRKNGKSLTKTWHWCVARAWLGPKPKGYCINHKNLNKFDNNPNNLEYITIDENIDKSIKQGAYTYKHSKNVNKIKKDFEQGQSITNIARKYKMTWQFAYYIIKGYLWNKDKKKKDKQMALQADTWTTIPIAKNYEINKDGQIRNHRGHILRPCMINKHKAHLIYKIVHIYNPITKKAITKTVHRLMAITFLGLDEKDHHKIVRFINGNKHDYRLCNLELVDDIHIAIDKQSKRKVKTLTREQVKIIKTHLRNGKNMKEISELTGVKTSILYHIIVGKSYKNW